MPIKRKSTSIIVIRDSLLGLCSLSCIAVSSALPANAERLADPVDPPSNAAVMHKGFMDIVLRIGKYVYGKGPKKTSRSPRHDKNVRKEQSIDVIADLYDWLAEWQSKESCLRKVDANDLEQALLETERALSDGVDLSVIENTLYNRIKSDSIRLEQRIETQKTNTEEFAAIETRAILAGVQLSVLAQQRPIEDLSSLQQFRFAEIFRLEELLDCKIAASIEHNT